MGGEWMENDEREVAGGMGCKVRVVGSQICLRCLVGASHWASLGWDMRPTLGFKSRTRGNLWP